MGGADDEVGPVILAGELVPQPMSRAAPRLAARETDMQVRRSFKGGVTNNTSSDQVIREDPAEAGAPKHWQMM